MSRPSTRNKNKRPRPEDEVDERSEILRKIHARGCVIKDDIQQLYNISKKVCQGCRTNTKDNPNCFCGLIPPNGNRKAGLWQKMSEIVCSLGPDPSSEQRDSIDFPAGLTNLGATCYANSILQFLYMNRAFREGIFSVEPDILKQQPVLDQLARLFAQLQASKMSVIDSAPFIKTLELDNGVQQDSHEFLTLLLSLLEQCLRHSNIPKAKTIVQDLFRGSMSHVTRCSKCGQDSEASLNSEDFYELEVNIKGFKGLDESLDDYLNVEALEGDNQYYCQPCTMRTDATRCIKLRTLPPILNFQLKRCVFQHKTNTKKKITSAFSFPRVLDMGKRLSDPSELVYELSAVLVHKGTAVNSGHYIAHIKDAFSGKWWEFDDENVSCLNHHPFGEGSSKSFSSVDKVSGPNISCTEVSDNCTNEGLVDVNRIQSDVSNHMEVYTSSDAYMLMYTRRENSYDLDKSQTMCIVNCSKKEDAEPLSSSVSLPCHLLQEVEQLNASYIDVCGKYKFRKDSEIRVITEKKEEVRNVLAEAPVMSLDEPYFWIATEWLRQWADNATTLAIDNSSITCSHGKVPASKISFIKRLSAKAWTLLYSKYDGGPCLSNEDCCIHCLQENARAIVNADNYKDRRASLKDTAEAAIAGKLSDGQLYHVSKHWLQQWVRRKISDFPCEADAGPTASIRCPHGQLLPEQAPGAKRVLIPETLWLFLYEDSNSINPEDHIGCSVFPADASTCSDCCIKLTEAAFFKDSMREVKLKERQNHEKLALGKSIPLSSGCKYYLLPSSWLSKWRSYVNAIGKNVSSASEPDSLEGIIDTLRCEKHSLLAERPPSLVIKRGTVVQKLSPSDGLAIVTDNDWKVFCEEWGGVYAKGIVAEIEYSNSIEDDPTASFPEVSVTEEQINVEVIDDDDESKQPLIKTWPKVCEECIGERESCELVERLNYCNEDICVCLVKGKEAPKSLLDASRNMFEPDRRTSKRSRKTAIGDSINLKVSGSTSVYQLKMMIWESFGVVKENQLLHKGRRVIDNETSTLADFNVFPGDVLWVMDSKVHEYRDIADELSDPKLEVRGEGGFRGTLLTSSTQSQLV